VPASTRGVERRHVLLPGTPSPETSLDAEEGAARPCRGVGSRVEESPPSAPPPPSLSPLVLGEPRIDVGPSLCPSPSLSAGTLGHVDMRTTDDTAAPLLGGHVVDAQTVGEAWIAVAELIAATGMAGSYDGAAMRECLMVTIRVAEPRERDAVIDRYGDPARLAWMHGNFTDAAPVPALGDADSYATRLFDYARSGRDQIAWVVERLRRDQGSRSATITTFQPLTDATYIPCVSLLDFFVADNRLHLVVYAHSIDFGAKGYGNLVELAHLLHVVSSGTDVPVGTLQMIVKSAHVYESDDAEMARILARSEQAVPSGIG